MLNLRGRSEPIASTMLAYAASDRLDASDMAWDGRAKGWTTLLDAGKARRARALRRVLCSVLSLPPAWLPVTHTPLATDAARIVSKLDAWRRVA